MNLNDVLLTSFLFGICLIQIACQQELDTYGRIKEIDEIIKDPYVLQAITFSVNDKTNKYAEIIEDAIERIEEYLIEVTNKKILKYSKYYIYVLENVRKYTVKWLLEEIQGLVQKTNEKPNEKKLKRKRNVAEFIYYTASEFGIDLVMENKELTFGTWKKVKRFSKIAKKSPVKVQVMTNKKNEKHDEL